MSCQLRVAGWLRIATLYNPYISKILMSSSIAIGNWQLATNLKVSIISVQILSYFAFKFIFKGAFRKSSKQRKIVHQMAITPFHSRYMSLIINGVMYDKEALLEQRWMNSIYSQKGDAWQKSLQNFLNNWLDERPYISVQTSGSTSKPKPIQLSKEQMMNSAFMTGKYFNFKSGQKALLCLPCDYIAGKMMVVRAMIWGLDLQLVSPSGNPMMAIEKAIDFAAMIPLQVTSIYNQSPDKFSLLKKTNHWRR